MKHISELQTTLSEFFDWHKSRIGCLIQILQALFCVKTVNLTQLANAFQSEASEDSSYRRIRRFFADFSFDLSIIVPLILRLFPFEKKMLLLLDRTNWKWGKTPINILMLSVVYGEISIPIFWIVLDAAGCSPCENRIYLLKNVLEKFDLNKIEALVADREFVGKNWFNYLVSQKIPFVIRVKGATMVDGIRADYRAPVRELSKRLGTKRKLLNYPIDLWGCHLYVSVRWKKNAPEPIIIISNVLFENPIEIY